MPNAGFNDYVKLNKIARDSLLEGLDVAAGAANPTGAGRRSDRRYPFRLANIPTLLAQADAQVGRFLVVTRNISRGGFSFVHGSFVHVGSRCQITLPNAERELVVLKGTTVSCRHIKGMIHEVGVRFDKKIDVRQFNLGDADAADEDSIELPALSGHALLIMEASSPQEQALATALHAAGMSIAPARTIEQAVEQITSLPTNLVIFDARMPRPTPADAARIIRAAPYAGLLVALDPNADRRTSDADGFDLIATSTKPARLLRAIADHPAATPPSEHPRATQPGAQAA